MPHRPFFNQIITAIMMRTYDLYDPNGHRAVIYSQAARQGRRIELGLQVFNNKTMCFEKRLMTQLLPEDTVGICFELQRLCDKAQEQGFRFTQEIVGAGHA